MIDIENQLQGAIENIYRIDHSLPVSAFRINREILELFLGEGAGDVHRETLVVRGDGDEVDLGLYIAPEVVTRANACVDTAPRSTAAEIQHLDEFCVTTEGVSHFVYVTFCGEQQDRSVSQIELELQAEIDKYLVIRTLFPNLGDGLVRRLYDQIRLADRLTHGERERYTVANRAGRRYARWLHHAFSRGRGEDALRDARALYRQPLAAKLDRIDRAA